jgi:hypothetical protein
MLVANGEGPPSAVAAALIGMNSNLLVGRNGEAGQANSFGGQNLIPKLEGKDVAEQVF